jgi:hypothetical protein
VQLLGSAAEVEIVDDGEEIGQLPDVHRACSRSTDRRSLPAT